MLELGAPSSIMVSMNRLDTKARVAILRCLVEGNSIRSTARITGTSKNTVLKLLSGIGQVASEYQDVALRNLPCKRIQCDEIWSFVGAKEKNVRKGAKGVGDVWTWTAICPDSKLVPTWMVGPRDSDTARAFMVDLASRPANRIQLTTDGHSPYIDAVGAVFGMDIDYAMLVKEYGSDSVQSDPARRYSPSHCTGSHIRTIEGEPDEKYINTSFVERQNLTMRMSIRRFTRLTNAFSRKVENHAAAVALHFFHYNFCRIHKSLRVTPAMEAGVEDHVWELDELVELLEQAELEADAASPVRPGRKPKGESK